MLLGNCEKDSESPSKVAEGSGCIFKQRVATAASKGRYSMNICMVIFISIALKNTKLQIMPQTECTK